MCIKRGKTDTRAEHSGWSSLSSKIRPTNAVWRCLGSRNAAGFLGQLFSYIQVGETWCICIYNETLCIYTYIIYIYMLYWQWHSCTSQHCGIKWQTQIVSFWPFVNIVYKFSASLISQKMHSQSGTISELIPNHNMQQSCGNSQNFKVSKFSKLRSFQATSILSSSLCWKEAKKRREQKEEFQRQVLL